MYSCPAVTGQKTQAVVRPAFLAAVKMSGHFMAFANQFQGTFFSMPGWNSELLYTPFLSG